MTILSVSNNAHPFDLARTITDVIREQKHAEIQARGAEAVNQAVKALVLATSYLNAEDIFVNCVAEYSSDLIENGERTGIKIVVDPYYPH